MDRSTKPKATNVSRPLGLTAVDPAPSRRIRKCRRRLPVASSSRTRAYDAADEAISMPIEAVFDFERLDFIVVDGSGQFSGRPWVGVTTVGATGAVLDVFCEFKN